MFNQISTLRGKWKINISNVPERFLARPKLLLEGHFNKGKYDTLLKTDHDWVVKKASGLKLMSKSYFDLDPIIAKEVRA